MKKLIVVSALIFISNISNSQNLEWVRKFGDGNIPGVFGHSNVAVDAYGNVYTIGSFWFQIDCDPGPGTYIISSVDEYDIFVSKLDASGNFIWARSFGGTGSDYGRSVNVDVAGNVILTGTFKNTVDFNPGTGIYNITSNGDFDIFIVKLDSSGNFLWAGAVGGTGVDQINSVAVDGQGNIYATGFFEGLGDFDPGLGFYSLNSSGTTSSTFVLKVSTSGNLQWAKAIGGVGETKGNSIAVDASGNVTLSGGYWGTIDFDPGSQVYNVTSAGAWDFYILKLDAAGNFLWVGNINRSGFYGWNLGSAMTVDAQGNVYTAGYFAGMVDFDPGSGIFNLTSLGVADIFIFKLDVSGNFVWAKLLSGTYSNYFYSIGIVAPGNLYITGSFAGTVDFDPGPGIYNLTSIGNGDIFIASLDSSGNFVWATAMGGGDLDYGNSITVDVLGNIYTTGGFQGLVDFDPGTGIINLTSVGVDIFTHKMSYITGIEELSYSEISVYPNPANNKIIISSEDKEIGEVKILDIVGKLIKLELINDINAEIDVLEIKPGLYFIELRNQRIKIIKQ